MNEKLLQFIWRYRYIDATQLQTIDGESLQILQAGQYNANQGPDFLEAKIKIGNTIMVGHIELHIKSSDWDTHKHSEDINYNNVILHVVWIHDRPCNSRISFATIELQNYVPKQLLTRYDYLLSQPPKFVACQNVLPVLSELGWINWKERLGMERLKRKSRLILQRLQYYNNDWASVFWEELAAAFGSKANTECFRALASSIPLAIIRRNREQLLVLEALLLGQLGLLDKNFEESYPNQLKKEYQYQKQKYGLKKVQIPVAFLRMHPHNFPTIRIAQLASLLHISEHLFSKILEIQSVDAIAELLTVTAHSYWDNHYVLDKESTKSSVKNIGDNMIHIVLINCIVPVVFSYGEYHQDEKLQERALNWLSQLTSEENKIIAQWKLLGISSSNALESQSLLELFNQYCTSLRCLSCHVGIAYLKQ